MTAYYNEFDPQKAAWLRELIRRDLIAQGDVDERSIADVQPADLAGYTQCHFFAGIGVWSYALRLAGWSDNRPVWTGSCPCQPYSAAGKGKGENDLRHLWPSWFRLIRERRPDVAFGEQVEAAIRHGWLDAISTDMEGEGYAIGSVVFGAHSVGAPHKRQRLYFVADANSERRAGEHALLRPETNGRHAEVEISQVAGSGEVGDVAVSESEQHNGRGHARRGRREFADDSVVGNFWDDANWLPCSDGKTRPVEPGTFPLAHGTPARVGRLRGYGDAIVAPQAATFIQAYLDVICA